MKVIVDNKIPFIKEVIGKIADEVIYVPGKDFTPALVKDADERGRAASTECYVKNLLRLFLHQTNKVLDERARRFDSCTIDISFHNSQY